MRKRLILLFILLSIQLYGCSDRQPEKETVILPVPESSVVGEDGAIEAEMSTAELDEEPLSIVTETENSPAPVENTVTENTADVAADASQSAVPQPEESVTTTDDGFYHVATDIAAAEVERYAAQVRQQFLAHDWQALSSEISYPVTIADTTYNNSAEFLEASGSFDGSLDDAFFSALENEDCVEMFCNYQGIMLGETGQVWIGEVLGADLTSQGLKIITVNGLLK